MISALLASLSGKAAAAAIAGTVAAGGLGVAAVTLPDNGAENIPVETVDDERVSTAAVEGEGGELEAVLEDDAVVTPEEDDDDAGPPADSFGARVSADAKDGGVDGREIAAEASEGRSEQGRETGAEASEGRSEAGAENRPESPDAEGKEQAAERKAAGQANRAGQGDDVEETPEAEETPENEETPEPEETPEA